MAIFVPDFVTLHAPWRMQSAIYSRAGNDRRIPRGADGAFRGGSCESKDCPSGYACEEIADLDGEVSAV